VTERIYTGTGDRGETGLFGGDRVAKDAARVEATGAVDELNAVVGSVRSCGPGADHDLLLATIQDDLFSVGADLATPGATDERRGSRVVTRFPAERVRGLEREIDRMEAELPPLASFVLPGGCELACRLHIARTVCRRAERRCVTLSRAETINPTILAYLNRLSDLLFVMARCANRRADVADVAWSPRSDPG
jgi:cob(I)alamin adenosyltransferase